MPRIKSSREYIALYYIVEVYLAKWFLGCWRGRACSIIWFFLSSGHGCCSLGFCWTVGSTRPSPWNLVNMCDQLYLNQKIVRFDSKQWESKQHNQAGNISTLIDRDICDRVHDIGDEGNIFYTDLRGHSWSHDASEHIDSHCRAYKSDHHIT